MEICWNELGKQAWPSHDQMIRHASLKMLHRTVTISDDKYLVGDQELIDECLRVSRELAKGMIKATREGHQLHMSKGAHLQFQFLDNFSDPCGWYSMDEHAYEGYE